MKVLVSTVKQLLFVDIERKLTSVIESSRKEYYGISWFKDSPRLVLGHSSVTNSDLIDLASYANSEVGYLSFGDTHSVPFLSEPHQLLCAPNGWVITTNTGRNCITLYNPVDGFYKDIRINNIRWDRLTKNNPVGEHFNSVFLKVNKLYVVAHAFSKGSYILEFSFPDCELLKKHSLQYGTGIHNIWVDDDDNIIVCDTLSGSLLNVKNNQTCWSTEAAHYTRGLAVTKDIILVGDSELAPRESRDVSHGDIWVIDRHTMKTLDCIPLGRVGGIHDIRILDLPDEAHHQHPFANIEWLESIAQPINPTDESLTLRSIERLERDSIWEKHKNITSNFHHMFSHLTISHDNWIYPYQEGFSLAIFKAQPPHHYHAAMEYQFNSLQKHQHLSLVIGYQGGEDTNMLACLLEHDEGSVTLGMWQNDENGWVKIESLLTNLNTQGHISLQRDDNALTIKLDGKEPMIRHFDSNKLTGRVGVRSLGAKFRNFTLKETSPPSP